MSVAGAQAQAKKLANQNHASSDAQEIGDNIKDLGRSFGDMAMCQYLRAHDAVTDSFQEAGNAEAGNAVQRNPLTAIGIGLGVGFLFGLVTGGRSRTTHRHSS
jgi:ElaB/YqjD/DUF883 family membrane-anchored ribosome-binding protein